MCRGDNLEVERRSDFVIKHIYGKRRKKNFLIQRLIFPSVEALETFVIINVLI
jgi:hypothetical protein